MSDRTTLLLTALGSMVVRAVLDALEGRRADLRVVGCGSDPTAPDRARCDAFHHVPVSGGADWDAEVRRIVTRERPDAVVPGRDRDVRELARLAEGWPPLAAGLLAGSTGLAAAFDDKAATAAFALRHGLPHVPTMVTDDATASAEAAAMIAAHGLPLISKPRDGNGSRGVRVLTDHDQVVGALGVPGQVLQPFLDVPRDTPLRPDLALGTPLFWEVPEERLFVVQVLIGRDGTVLGALPFRSRHVRGRPEEFWVHDDPALLRLGTDVAAAAASEGWRGPLNVQAKRDAAGGYHVIELNGRFSGGTSARLLLGFDEVGLLLDDLLGRPVLPARADPPVRRVVRMLADVPVGPPEVPETPER